MNWRLWSLRIQVVFYLVAGINHFRSPQFYLPLIPDYLSYPLVINQLSGILELFLALGLAFSSTRKVAVWGGITLLIVFVPSHIYFIELGGCVPEGLCTPMWVAWLRLVFIHPLLLLWLWMYRKDGLFLHS